MTLNIVADENMEGLSEYLGHLGTIHRIKGRGLSNSDLHDADVLLVRSVTAVNETLLAGTSVKFVGSATSGFDHVDKQYLDRAGIAFAHAPGSNANSVVEYVLAAIGSVDQKLEQLFAGGTVGIVGYGNIGRLLAKRLAALQIDYVVYDPWLKTEQISNPTSLNNVLRCDVVSVHAALTGIEPWPSYHLFSPDELAQIPQNTLFINASRGAIVDNIALQQRLAEVDAPVTILDVWEQEPTVDEALLAQVRFGTAHIAGYSRDGKLLATKMLRDALLKSRGESTPVNEQGVAVPDIHLPGGLSGAALLRALLAHNYSLSEDDRLLRESVVGLSDSTKSINFDRLRKGYRSRREVYGARVVTELHSPCDQSILTTMGCELAARGAQC
jgi:erythronate-4-phosphate dehydrogenase